MIEGGETGRKVGFGEAVKGGLSIEVGGLEGLGDLVKGLSNPGVGATHVC